MSQRLPWLVFLLVTAATYGNYYVYDSIGPVAGLLNSQRGFSDTQIGMLNAIYSLPNIVLILTGGILTDRFGAPRVTLWTAAICLAGAALTAWSPTFTGMAAGRLLFGIGAETFNISTLAAIAQHFTGRNLAFAMGLSLAIGRFGSYSADMSPEWFASSYAAGWQPPLIIAAWLAATSFVAALLYWWLDRKHAAPRPTHAAEPFAFAHLLKFDRAYWFLLSLCVLFYAPILAFRSTFSIKYFQHAHGLTLPDAGAMNSYVFLAAMFTTPAFGWLCDKIGRYAPLLAFGALTLPISFAIMAATNWNLWIATALIGVSYSLVPAVMWPYTSKLLAPDRFGTGLGLMWVIQNAGIAGANLIAGYLNDRSAAGELNPNGYQPMMLFFGITSALGFAFALLLWSSAGRHEREAAQSRTR